ncbi:OmpH family outer membrane protein [Rhodospirillum centenum]|uniref:Outer membrane protein OmpH n=1 Tax=Rhodospirillum centenum (strain ATCC 51521 / SW) TaxID=414684 RepID=B6ISU2_RHOCS|nr:OmpH family outer membrane protein [Rhodospirillum centenum]ACI98613.1 outer membrane protein OmpH precursor [Rhodospirillum centenum SW]
MHGRGLIVLAAALWIGVGLSGAAGAQEQAPVTPPPAAHPVGPAAEGQLQPTIAIVDAQGLLSASSAWRSIQQQLTALQQDFQAEMNAQITRLRSLEQDLAKQRQTQSAEEFDRARKQFEQEVAESRQHAQERARILDTALNDAKEKLLDMLGQVVRDVAKERGIVLVLHREAVLYRGDPSLDLTDVVLQRLNARLPQVTVVLPK